MQGVPYCIATINKWKTAELSITQQAWIDSINRKVWIPSSNPRVCSDHFIIGNKPVSNPQILLNFVYITHTQTHTQHTMCRKTSLTAQLGQPRLSPNIIINGISADQTLLSTIKSQGFHVQICTKRQQKVDTLPMNQDKTVTVKHV